MRPARGHAARALVVGLSSLLLNACGSAPPDAAGLLQQSSRYMSQLTGFHFQMELTGATGTTVPVQRANGDAHPPDLHATVDLKEGGLLLEVEVIFKAGTIYLKSFTGGWQALTAAQVTQFFDPSALFDQQAGLFAAMRDTQSPVRGNQESVDGHNTYPISGTVSATRMHKLLSSIRDLGSFKVTYWIESSSQALWRARLSGNLFDATQPATITFDFSNHDHPVTITPPPLG